MVDASDIVLGCLDTRIDFHYDRSGTAATLRYAEAHGKEIFLNTPKKNGKCRKEITMPKLQKWINLTCDPRRVAEIWNESQSSDKSLDIEIVATRVKEFCKLLASLKSTNSDYIILALKFYENGIETIDAELIKGDDLHRAGMFLRDEFILKEKPLPSISPNSSNQELEAFLEQTTGWVPQAFAYEYTPWEEVLGSSVLFPNVTHVGNDEFLAAALYNMSFNGMTKEAQEQERKKLSTALAEIKSGACTYTAHEVLSDLEQTEAETAREKRQSLFDRAMTRYAWLMEISYLYDDRIFLRSSNENESGNKARIKQVNLEDIPKELTAEEQKMLEEVAKRPVVFEEDCPELTEDELKQFRSVLHFGR